MRIFKVYQVRKETHIGGTFYPASLKSFLPTHSVLSASQGQQHEPGPETKLPQCPALESGRQWFLIFNLLAPVPRDLGSNQTIVLHAVKLSWKTTNLWFEKWLLARAIRSYLCPELIIKKWREHQNEHETHPPIWVTGTYSFPNISPWCPHLPPTAIRQVS